MVGSDTPFAKSLAALSRFFVGDGTLEQTLTRVVDLSVEAVQAADMVGITMVVEGRNRTAVLILPSQPTRGSQGEQCRPGDSTDCCRSRRVEFGAEE